MTLCDMPPLRSVPCSKSSEGVCHQISTSGAKQLCNSPRAEWIEYRQSGSAFSQIKRQCCKASPAAQRKPDEKDGKRLQCQRNRRKPQRNSNMGADGHKQAGG